MSLIVVPHRILHQLYLLITFIRTTVFIRNSPLVMFSRKCITQVTQFSTLTDPYFERGKCVYLVNIFIHTTKEVGFYLHESSKQMPRTGIRSRDLENRNYLEGGGVMQHNVQCHRNKITFVMKPLCLRIWLDSSQVFTCRNPWFVCGPIFNVQCRPIQNGGM